MFPKNMLPPYQPKSTGQLPQGPFTPHPMMGQNPFFSQHPFFQQNPMLQQENLFQTSDMPYQKITNKKRLSDYQDKMIMIHSVPGFTHMFRLAEYKEDYIAGVMFTGKDYEAVKIPLDHIHCFYVAQSDYDRVNP